MKKRLVDAEAWLSQCAHSWMYYNTAKHIIERAPSYEVEEEYLTPIVSGEQAEPAPAPTKADKISRGARMKHLAPICRQMLVQPWEVIPASSEDMTGRDKLLELIETLLSEEAEETSEA